MTDILNENGLTLSTKPEIINELTASMQSIYGSDINVDSNSPDGQTINIYAQAATDLRELIMSVYNSFDPDNASGSVLDARCAINNVYRLAGSFTIVPITMVVSQTVTLQGLDENYNDINATGYTIQDSAGNKFILVDSVTLTAGTYQLNFRAEKLGLVETTLNTITIPQTVVLGVVSVTNAQAPLQIGANEETDRNLKIRRSQSTAMGSSGYLNGIQAKILSLNGVTEAKVFQNRTDAVDSNGIPAHSVWIVVEGGANTDIAQVIRNNLTGGTGMKGDVNVTILSPASIPEVYSFDRPLAKSLYIKFDVQLLVAGIAYDLDAFKDYITNNQDFLIGGYADAQSLTALAQQYITQNGGEGIVLNLQISKDNQTWTSYLNVDTLNEKWSIQDIDITVLAV